MLQDILVTGLVNGGVYALLAIGFSLIFGVARIVNIAHTAFYMLAAYCFYTLLVKTGLGFFLSGVISVAAVTLFSVVCYRLVIEPFLPPLYDDYDVHPDGRTLVLVQPASGTPVGEVSMILNWPEELKRVAPDR